MVDILLTAPGRRESGAVTKEEAKEHLKRWESDFATATAAAAAATASESEDKNDSSNDAAVVTTTTTIDLSCRVWTVDTLEVFRPFFERIRDTVVSLKLDDIIASLETQVGLETYNFFAQVFQQSPGIREISLNQNAIGDRGIDYLAPLLQGENIISLSFLDCGLSAEVAVQLSQVLEDVAPHLHTLNLGENQIGVPGAKTIGTLLGHCTALECFAYSGSRPRKEGTLALCQGLADATTNNNYQNNIRKLDMEDVHFDDNGNAVSYLCVVLRNAHNLEYLNLNGGGDLGANGIGTIVGALREAAAPLEFIDFGGNEAGAEGAQNLADWITDAGFPEKTRQSLKHLKLDDNELEDDGIDILVKALTNDALPNLQILNLETNLIGSTGFQALIDNRIESLQELNLKDNDLEDIDNDLVQQLRRLYPKVLLDLEEEEEEEQAPDRSVAELAAELQDARI